MKKAILFIALYFGALLGIFIIMNKTLTGYNWFDLAFPKKDSNYILPKGCKLVYNKHTKLYSAIVADYKYKSINDLKLKRYNSLVLDLWSCVDDNYEKAYSNPDSSKVKFLIRLYMDNQNIEKNKADFR